MAHEKFKASQAISGTGVINHAKTDESNEHTGEGKPRSANFRRFNTTWIRRSRLSLFEKVILANSLVLIGEALAGLWVTSHNIESRHYLIDTAFIVLATLFSLLVNMLLLRASFRPLFSLLHTMRAVSSGETHKRALVTASDSEIGELAQAFNSMLDRLEIARREQAMLILQAQDEERRRLALELHDESSQNLTAVLVHTEILSQSLQAIPSTMITTDVRVQLDEGLKYLASLTQHTLDNIRTLAQQLRPSVLDDLGLYAAFRWLAEDARQRLQLAVELHIDGVADTSQTPLVGGQKTPARTAPYETALFRITQECLTNIARHAHAQQVFISLTQDQEHICLQVRDDGCGYDPAQRQQGLGIFGMRERAALLGGTVTIESRSGQGTLVRAVLPL
jgi:two-component system, NarL family, sensor histidine kinase UhpB